MQLPTIKPLIQTLITLTFFLAPLTAAMPVLETRVEVGQIDPYFKGCRNPKLWTDAAGSIKSITATCPDRSRIVQNSTYDLNKW